MFLLETCTVNWFSKDEIYKVTKNIHSAVYSFVMAERIPTNKTLPFTIENLIYVGMSGGLKDDFTGDKKNKNSNKVTLTTPVHQRIKHHMRLLADSSKIIGHLEEKKYKLFHEKYSNSDLNLYICLTVPKEHVERDIMRNILSMVESEQIILYHRLYGNKPLMNLSEGSGCADNRKKIESYSQKEISKIKKQNIFELAGV